VLKALVIYPNDKTRDVGDLLAIARSQAQKRQHTHENVNIRSILYDSITGVFVALYETRGSKPLMQEAKRRER